MRSIVVRNAWGGEGGSVPGADGPRVAKIRQARGGYWSIGQPNRLRDALVGVIDGYRAKFRGPKRPWGRETSRAVCRRAESAKIRQARGWVAQYYNMSPSGKRTNFSTR